MAQKTEKLAEETYKKLVNLQTEINGLVNTIGTAHLQIRGLNEELKNVTLSLMGVEKTFDEKNEELNDVLRVLEKTYPSAEIDLADGTITYQEN
jgi:peptidoglycan hydrolase CwlO-like protein